MIDWQAISLSIQLAAATTVALLVLGLPLAYWLSITRFRGKWLVEAVVALPLVLPPTVLGFYVLNAIGSRGALGRIYEQITGDLLPFSFEGLLLGSILYSLPFAVQPFLAAFSAIDPAQIEASWCLGASKLRTFARLIVPLSLPGIVSGMILSFAHTLGEFGIVMMIGGNIPGRTRTASVAIYDSVQALDYAGASRTALILLGFSFLVLATTTLLRRRMPVAWKPA
jgi:molybdate transport system permease protein